LKLSLNKHCINLKLNYIELRVQSEKMDFYIHKYNIDESIASGRVAPHRYRLETTKQLNRQNECLNAWHKDKPKILAEYITKLKTFYAQDEIFLLFIPPTNTKIFLNDIIEEIKREFPNAIDFTCAFIKKSNDSFGGAKFNDKKIEELASLVAVNENILLTISPNNVTKAFIADDVYSSGKSILLTKYLIEENYSRTLEIKSGVVLWVEKDNGKKSN
jgi:hypothetical protein